MIDKIQIIIWSSFFFFQFLGNHHQVRVADVVLDEPSAHDDHAGVGGAHRHGIQLAEVALKFTSETCRFPTRF